ncbi:hypothetical protein LguiA_000382 [Lonicera macranthoides]
MSSSETDFSDPSSLIERLINSRNRDLSLFLPVILGFTNNSPTGDDDNDEESSPDAPATRGARDRIILINPLTQGMVVIEGSSASLDSLLRDMVSKGGQPPAARSAIESMPAVEIGECEIGECVICLEEWGVGEVVKEMPCKHRFHGNCVEKWLGIHGTCPVCRYKMPVDDGDDFAKKFGSGDGEEGRGNSRREIWVTFSLNSGDRRSGDNSSESGSTSPRLNHYQMED